MGFQDCDLTLGISFKLLRACCIEKAKGNCAKVECFSRSLWLQSCCHTGFSEEVYSLLKSRFAKRGHFSKTTLVGIYLIICWFSSNWQIHFELHEPDTEWAVLAAKTDAEQSKQDLYLISQQRSDCIGVHSAHDLSVSEEPDWWGISRHWEELDNRE